MEWSAVLSYIQGNESDSVHFFARVDYEEELAPTIVAFANHKGGIIFVGIDVKNYHLLGTTVEEAWVQSVIDRECKPKMGVTIESVFRNEKKIILIKVDQGVTKPYVYRKKCYVRDHVNTRLATVEEEDAMREATPPLTESEDIPVNEAPPESPEVKNTVSSHNFRQKEMLVYLKSHKTIKNKEYRDLFKVSHKTAHIELVDMVAKGFLSSQGSGRSTCYILNPHQNEQIALGFDSASQDKILSFKANS